MRDQVSLRAMLGDAGGCGYVYGLRRADAADRYLMEIADPRIDPALVPAGSRARVINGPDREYLDLPAVITPTGKVITRWTPSDEERQRLLAGEDIYLTIWSGGLINPVCISVGPCDWTGD